MATLSGLTVAGLAAPGMAADPDPRVAGLHPFSVASAANTAIGSGAIFESATATRTAALLKGTATINSTAWSIAVYIAKTSDPVVTLTDSSKGVVRSIYLPADAQVTAGLDKALTVVQPDGVTAYETYKMAKLSATAWTSTNVIQTDLRNTGLLGGTRAAGISQLVGLIRTEEVAAAKIPHVLAVSIPDSMLKVGPVWPARLQDNNSATAYKGPIAMGTMMGIPPSVNLATLGLSAEGLALAKAFQDYGAYVVDRSETIALYTDPKSNATAVARMKSDYQKKLFPLLRIITNSTATNIAGGGTRRQPAAAEFYVAPPAPVAPGQPVVTSAAAGDRQATVGWTAPTSTGGSAITGYTVTSSSGTTSTTDGSARSAVVTGLTAGQSYTFTVTARNAVASGAVSTASSAVKLAYTDVAAGSAFAADVDWFVSTGLGTGLADGSFGAANANTRAEIAVQLYKLAGSPAVTATTSAFTDVPVSSPSFKAITWMAAQGITTGTLLADGTRVFSPNDQVSRAITAVFLYRAAGSPAFTAPATSPFTDVATTYSFYKEITWLVANGIAKGTTVPASTTYQPTAPTTRLVTATYLHRFDALA
ncbi:S-layer homology domain-containing protein [Pengzhenrongella sicca]|uniref:S-layer homology domain-containing protein n=1 Tax=Pengzhenrongella sicca TaxID=2819238 RepID=A0A8A4Z7K2_9MICO|nr:S-layer homology domain-containing protein [Pengzhenrongella sicca]QTE27880.1 S-layer homology domain-containing protein [Pengzhenrongella sicca]